MVNLLKRLIEYIECESITGEALCEDIKQTLLKLNLRLEDTVSQAYDGAANFSGHTKGCASRFQSIVPHAEYFHCSNHDLNLALCHTYHDIPEIRNMINCVTELGLFFKYSPKRVMSWPENQGILFFYISKTLEIIWISFMASLLNAVL